MRLRSIFSLKSITRWPSLITILFWSALLSTAGAAQSITLTWPPNPEPDVAGYFVYFGAVSGNYTNVLDVGDVTTNTVSGLVEGVTYYFEVTAYDTLGLESAPSTEISYTIPVVVPPSYTPVAGTLTPVVNGSTAAVLNGAVNPNGAATVAWFEYGYDSNYGWTAGSTNLGSGTSTLWMSSPLAGLLPGQTYHYRVVASNSVGVTNGTDLAFTLPAALPVITTQQATGVKESAATLNAVVNPNGGATVVWFEYGSSNSYASSTPALNVPAGNGPVALNTAITGLQPGTTYHFRVAANNSAGITYGADLSFQTPQVQAGTSVTLAWPANPETNIAGYIVYYGGASGAYTNSIDVGNVTNYTVSGLVSGATYYFNVAAYNDLGLESQLSGEVSVTTGPVAGRPILGTATANANTPTSALMFGQVNPNGAATTVWFQYGLSTAYGKSTSGIEIGNGTSLLSVYLAVGSLLPGSTYHYRVVAINSVGVTLGSDLTFATAPDLPSASTEAASDITSGTATLNAVVNAGGSGGGYYFEYGLDTTYGVVTDSGPIPAGSPDLAVSMPVAQLLAGRVYHYRVLATNSAGKMAGMDATFTTLALAPEVTTDPPDSIGLAEATLNGDADPNGANTSVWFEYGVTTNYASSTAAAEIGASDGDLTYSAHLSNLLSSMTYHYRMVASNSLGVTYGADVTFSTLSPNSDVTTLPATDVTTSMASLQGAANPNNTPGGAWFEYGLTTNYGFSTPAQDLGSGGNFVPVTCLISNLQAGQTWHYRLVATNSGGSTYGSDMTFTTPVTDLSAVTLATRLVKTTSVSLYASVTPMAYPATVYFEYGTTTNFTSISSSIQLNAGTSTTTVNKRVYNLVSGTTYYYRVVATNKYDKVYGQILSFTTR